jgi:hypothetical protein
MLAKISQYYKQKSHIEINDQYHTSIEQGDIDILRNSLTTVIITPFAALFGMYVLKAIKNEVGKSSSFMF